MNKTTQHKTKITEGRLGRSLLLSFLALSIVPLTVVSTAFYKQAYHSLLNTAIKSLSAITNLKSEYINTYFQSKLTDLDFQSQVQSNLQLLNTLREAFVASGLTISDFTKSYKWSQIISDAENDLTHFRDTYEYYDVFLIDHEGNILFTIAMEADLGTNIFTGKYANTQLGKACRKAFNKGKPVFSDFEFYEPSNKKLAGFLVQALVDNTGEKIGLIALQIQPENINPVLHDNTGLGKTGESYLVSQDYLMRSDPNSNMNAESTILNPEHKVETKIIKDGVQTYDKRDNGENINATDIDDGTVYIGRKGSPVIGFANHLKIAGVPLCIVAEIEEREAFAPALILGQITLLMVSITVIIVFSIAIKLTRQIIEPVTLLLSASQKMEKGHLSEKLAPSRNDEIGRLTESFNAMRESLQHRRDALLQSEEKLRGIVETAGDAIVMIDDLGDIQSFNPAAEHMFKYTNDAIKGKSIADIISFNVPGHNHRFLIKTLQTINGKNNSNQVQMGIQKNSRTFPIQLSIGEIRLEARSNYSVIIRDITEIEETREKLEKNNRMLEEKNQLQTRLVTLGDRLRSEQLIENLGAGILSFFADDFDAQVGAFFIVNSKNTLKMVSKYAFNTLNNLPEDCEFGEGLVGQAARDGKRLIISPAPSDYIRVHSAVGEAVPTNILIIPVLYDNFVVAVIELASFHEFTEDQINFLDHAIEDIGVTINSSLARQKMKKLLEESNFKSEELQKQQKQLRAANEELEEKTNALTMRIST